MRPRLWALWATARVVHKSTGLVIGLSDVDDADPMGAIVHRVDAILAGRAKRDRLAPETLADAPGRFRKLMKPSRSTSRT